ncbi:hypothetical protein [Pseudomonas aeruginosa]
MNLKEIVEFIRKIVIGTVSGMLIKFGAAFLVFGMWDVAIYFFDSYVMKKNIAHPGDSFGWLQALGLTCFLTGLFIKLYSFLNENNSKLRGERLWLKENYSSLSDARLQDEFERLYHTRNADIRAIKNLFNHPYNKNIVIRLFASCHLNVVPAGDWFVERGRYISLRYRVGFLAWCLFPVLIFLTLLLAAAEYAVPGISKSGPYAMEGFLLLAAITVIGAKLMLDELSTLGRAMTLVNAYKP